MNYEYIERQAECVMNGGSLDALFESATDSADDPEAETVEINLSWNSSRNDGRRLIVEGAASYTDARGIHIELTGKQIVELSDIMNDARSVAWENIDAKFLLSIANEGKL